jgi:hypothetical protein
VIEHLSSGSPFCRHERVEQASSLLELTEKQRKRIADVLTDTGKIVFTASVVAPFFQNAPVKPWLVIAGVVTAVALYVTALF